LLHQIQATAYKSEWNEALEHGDKMLVLLTEGLQKAQELKDNKPDPEAISHIEQKMTNLTAIYTEMERLIRAQTA